MTKSPTNTTAEVRENPILGLLSGTPEGILETESAGQRQMVASDVLPVEISSGQDRSDFEALGFVFGDPVSGDRLFVAATLPPGWKREGNSHSLWSYLVDERGLRRVSIFYKAAFYDRSAFMSLLTVGSELGRHLMDVDDPEIPENEKRTVDLSIYISGEIEDARQYLARVIEQYAEDARYGLDRTQRISLAKAALAKLS